MLNMHLKSLQASIDYKVEFALYLQNNSNDLYKIIRVLYMLLF